MISDLNPDKINGLFEISGALLLLLNIKAILRDRAVSGVHWGPVVLWTLWGVWNLYYYPHLDQWWSFYGGCAVVAMNGLWLGLLAYFKWFPVTRQTVRSIGWSGLGYQGLTGLRTKLVVLFRSFRVYEVRLMIFLGTVLAVIWVIRADPNTESYPSRRELLLLETKDKVRARGLAELESRVQIMEEALWTKTQEWLDPNHLKDFPKPPKKPLLKQ